MATYSSIKYDFTPPDATTSAQVGAGAMKLITSVDASSDSTIQFTSGIDSTYKTYIIKFIDMHPETDDLHFKVNFRDGSTAYDATKTTTFFYAYHAENDAGAALLYETGSDVAQGTGVQTLTTGQGGDSDQTASGTLHLFDPSSTTFVKHFIATCNYADSSPNNNQINTYIAGYCNTTSAIDGVQFSMSSGNIDAGTFKLYGIA